MGVIRSSSTDEFLNSKGGRENDKIIGVDTPVETGGNNNVVVPAVISDDSDDYVLVDGIEDLSDEEDDLFSITSSESESEDDGSDDEYDEELEEGLKERRMILADASNLKLLAKNFLYPEEKIVSNGNTGHCYFDRASAPEEMSKEDADERAMILSDAKALKTTAVEYLHPEVSIDKVDPTVFGRNYFAAYDDEDAGERAQILAEAAMLKKHATYYLHPEVEVVNNDGTSFGYNYFDRVSAPEGSSMEESDELAKILSDAASLKMHAVSYAHPEIIVTNSDPASFGRNYFASGDIEEDEEERAQILAEAIALKKVASDYFHPEAKHKNMDSTSFGRNYFNRLDAPEIISNEEAKERAQILADVALLKKDAVAYSHPEAPIEVDSTAFGRNYFNEDNEDDEERAQILAEATMFKKHASDYLHPEAKVESADPTIFGRNYFNRSDAPEVVTNEEAEEHAQILADVALLKREAITYSHPEASIKVDSTAFGRNHFAATTDMEEDEEERSQILAEAAMFKKLASDYLHPEAKVENVDYTLCSRNYFNRPDALEASTYDDAEERAQIIADVALLKKEAVRCAHPEVSIEVDSTVFGRNYFTATNNVDEDEEEHAQILAEATMFKKLASNYLHPEAKVDDTDDNAFGRNYFNRPDAPAVISIEEAEERAQILVDAALLKKETISYAHPEAPIEVDSTAFGRNYFTATSDMDEDEEERAQILAETAMFKKFASDYLHPETKVENTDATLFGRNYFNKPDAPEVSSLDEAEERAQIIADAALLKQGAFNYNHPEASITVDSTAFGRNYFAATSCADKDEEERAQILAEVAMFKKLSIDYLHPEAKVENTDVTLFGRNYFSRPDAAEVISNDEAEERDQILVEAALLKSTAIGYSQPDKAIEYVDPTLFGRNYFTGVSSVDYIPSEDYEERAQILSEADALKKAATDYAHPEFGVANADPTAFARNFFHAAAISNDSKISAYAEGDMESPVSDEESVDHHDHDMFEFDDYHQFTDMHEQLSHLNQPKKTLPHAASFADFAHSTIEIKGDDEEGHLSRSPSCVSFFNYF